MTDMITYNSFFVHDGIPSMRDSQIIKLYDRIHADGTFTMMNFEGSIGSPREFVKAAKDAFFFAEIYYGVSSVGMVWLNRYEHRRAHIHFCSWKNSGYPFSVIVECGRHSLDYLINFKSKKGFHMLDCIWGVAPADNRLACLYARLCGMKQTGLIRNYIWDASQGKSIDGIHFHYTRGAQ